MASEKATLLIAIKQTGSSVLSGIRGQLAKIVPTAGDVVNALKFVAQALINFTVEAGKLQEVKNAFKNLALSQGQDSNEMLRSMKKLSAGTINELELMKQANNALLLGLPIERFGDMLEIARSSAKATGQSMEFMLSSIVTGLGRGSKLMLDNLGIVFKAEDAQKEYAESLGTTAAKLSEADRKQAFINKALAVGKANADAAGTSNESLSDNIGRFTAALTDASLAIGAKFTPSMTTAIGWLANWVDMTAQAINHEDQEFVSIKKLSEEYDKSAAKIQTLKLELEKYNDARLKSTRRNSLSIQQDIAEEEEKFNKISRWREEAIQRDEDADTRRENSTKLRKEKELQREQDSFIQMQELKNSNDLMDVERIGLNSEQQLGIELKLVNQKLAIESDFQKKKQLLIDKANIIAKIKAVKVRSDQEKIDAAQAAAKVGLLNATSALVSAIAGRDSKAAFLVGKAAALAQTFVSTQVAMANAMATVPYPGNYAVAAQIKLAGGINMAAIAATTIQGLEDGGIVRASPGGTIARIGEGGRDEAVIPLDGSSGGFGTINLTVNGGMLGTQDEAREFIRVIDREFLRLRQEGESQAFEEDVS